MQIARGYKQGISVAENTNRVMSTFQNANFAYLMWPNVKCKQANSVVIICNSTPQKCRVKIPLNCFGETFLRWLIIISVEMLAH